jgi:hypothetical protein
MERLLALHQTQWRVRGRVETRADREPLGGDTCPSLNVIRLNAEWARDVGEPDAPEVPAVGWRRSQ